MCVCELTLLSCFTHTRPELTPIYCFIHEATLLHRIDSMPDLTGNSVARHTCSVYSMLPRVWGPLNMPAVYIIRV